MQQALDSGDEAKDPLPLIVRRPLLSKWATPGLSLILLIAVGWHLRDIDIHNAVPNSPLFWLALASYWAAPAISDFVIYRLLWKIPLEGLIALSRKEVGNALLFDLLGEAYFYGWVRKKVPMTTSPFGAIKDVTILSALVGNVVTLILMAALWPRVRGLDLGSSANALAASIGFVATLSIIIVLFGKRLFSLNRGELLWVSAIHLVRVLATTGLIALAWSLYGPDVDFGVWILLATAQLTISRLPLFVNVDVMFANIVIWFLGNDSAVQQIVAVTAILILLIHVSVAALLAIGDLVTVNRALERPSDRA